METVNYCSHCGAPWEPGNEQCEKCGHVLKRFRPGKANQHRPKVIHFEKANQGYQEFTIIGGLPDDG